MTKKELEAKIETLEQRIMELENAILAGLAGGRQS